MLNNAVRHAHTQIQISAEIINKQVCLRVEDDGEGIEESVQKELFKPFFRADQSRQCQTGGSGLGLAITKKIIKLHQGTVRYERSKVGVQGL